MEGTLFIYFLKKKEIRPPAKSAATGDAPGAEGADPVCVSVSVRAG